jgi:hypothetical protein
MKVITDKIDKEPGHAISRADVRLIVSAVPTEWTEQIRVVRLSASLSAIGVALYAHSSSGDVLTISSRGHTKEIVLRCVLSELVTHALGFKTGTFQHLQARHHAQVERLIAPLMAELLPQLSQKIVSVSPDDVA